MLMDITVTTTMNIRVISSFFRGPIGHFLENHKKNNYNEIVEIDCLSR